MPTHFFTFTVNGVKCEWHYEPPPDDPKARPADPFAGVRKAAALFAADRWGPGELRVLDEGRRAFAWAAD